MGDTDRLGVAFKCLCGGDPECDVCGGHGEYWTQGCVYDNTDVQSFRILKWAEAFKCGILPTATNLADEYADKTELLFFAKSELESHGGLGSWQERQTF